MPRARRPITARPRERHPSRATRFAGCAAALVLSGALAAAAAAGEGTIPNVHGFTPQQGPPGTVVKIAGEHLDQVLAIEFAGGAVADFRLFSSSMLKVEVPDGAATGTILLRSANGGAWTPSSFRVTGPAPGRLALAPPSPNPGAGPFRIEFHAPGGERLRLDVFDLAGRRVRALADGVFAAGPQHAAWDARDAAGRRAAPGVYLVALRQGRAFVTRRIALLD